MQRQIEKRGEEKKERKGDLSDVGAVINSIGDEGAKGDEARGIGRAVEIRPREKKTTRTAGIELQYL